MTDTPIYVEVSMRADGGTGEVMFTQVYSDGHRQSYWLPFWKACWHSLKLISSGVTIKDVMP